MEQTDLYRLTNVLQSFGLSKDTLQIEEDINETHVIIYNTPYEKIEFVFDINGKFKEIF